MSNRHLARTLVLQSLFQWDFNEQKENINKLLEHNKGEFAPDFDDQDFSQKLLKSVADKIKDIDKLITKYAPEWPLEQITVVDRNVLRMGIYELKYAEDIPPKVAINEAIELAKTYGGESSGKFVNGVLGSVFKDMQESGEKKEFENEPDREFSAGGVVYRKEDNAKAQKSEDAKDDEVKAPASPAKRGEQKEDEGNNYKFALVLDAYDKWTFPKGHIEASEDQEKAAEREVCEEIGIKNTTNHGYLGSIDIKVNEPNKRPVPKTVHYYLIETTDQDLKITAEPEVKDAKWVDKNEALKIISYENAKEIFNAALKKLKIN